MAKDDDDREENNFGHNNSQLYIAIFSLFAVFIIIILLYLYTRYLQRRRHQPTRRQVTLNRQRVAHGIASTDNHQITMDSSTEPHPTDNQLGVDPVVRASLPKFTYKELGRGELIECSVCLSTVVEDAIVRQLPNCKHMFHVECIDMWLGSHSTCPICRATAEPEVKDSGTQLQEPTAPPVEIVGSFSRRIQIICGDHLEQQIERH